MGGADRGQAVRRRCRAPRSRDREVGGRPRDLPLAARPVARAPSRGRGLARTSRRLDVRGPRDGHEDLVDDRLRAAPQPDALDPGRGEFVAQTLAKLGPQPPNFQNIVALNCGSLVTDGVELLPSHPDRSSRSGTRALLIDVRTDHQFDDAHIERLDLHPLVPRRLRLEARLARGPRSGDHVHRPRRRRRPARGQLAVAVGVHKMAGLLAGGMTNWRQEREPIAETDSACPRGGPPRPMSCYSYLRAADTRRA